MSDIKRLKKQFKLNESEAEKLFKEGVLIKIESEVVAGEIKGVVRYIYRQWPNGCVNKT